MFLPSSKILKIVLILSFVLFVIFATLGEIYKEDLLKLYKLEELKEASMTIAYVLFYTISASALTLLIRHAPLKMINTVEVKNKELFDYEDTRLIPALKSAITHHRLEIFAVIVNIIIIVFLFIPDFTHPHYRIFPKAPK